MLEDGVGQASSITTEKRNAWKGLVGNLKDRDRFSDV
jgi:hypothetical protein